MFLEEIWSRNFTNLFIAPIKISEIITSLTLNVPQESPWEIGIDDDGNADGDNSVRQMPHIVQVTGMQFTPIHTFRPEKQINLYDKTENGDGVISNYGEQRYISLENAVSGSIYNQEFV